MQAAAAKQAIVIIIILPTFRLRIVVADRDRDALRCAPDVNARVALGARSCRDEVCIVLMACIALAGLQRTDANRRCCVAAVRKQNLGN